MTENVCESCQTAARRAAGEEVSRDEWNRWVMWGCTCDEDTAAEAQRWMEMVSR